ncbi:Insertion element IS630 uncharacterized 39 kDa protein [Labeo rohita]|uniref:Insertion element IS630 uncharacterized 39 kDa protein n=1 Tax=Labeo rohita TaxID=84645 RepID=A0ABQ8MQZ7_LABRO|nr:Insertion element IS630 uncharacterized 39 kDa protein [Labeo rohita]
MEGAVRVRRVRIRGGRGGRGRGRGGEEVGGRGLGGEEVGGRGRGVEEARGATIVDHVINHGMTLREAGQRVQPNLSRYTVASIIRTFRNENRIARRPDVGGRGRMFTPEQETHIVNMRNTERVKQLRYDYVQRVMELEADVMGHELLFVDEAGFNLSKTRRRGRNIIGHRAIINVPGQRGGNITMCAAISQNGVVHHHATIGPYNTAHIIAFLDTLHDMLTVQRPEHTRYVIIWDNVSFHRAALVRNWFTDHPSFTALNLPPYSPFLNPIEEFFSAWRWKVYDRHPHQQVALLQAMEEACGDIDQASCQAWIRHSRRYFPRCLGLEDIACDVDEILWPDPERRHDVG